MTPEQMEDVARQADNPAGRELAKRAMKYVQNWDHQSIEDGIGRLNEATPSDAEARAGEGGDVTVTLPRDDAKMILAFALYGRNAATKAYLAGEGLEH